MVKFFKKPADLRKWFVRNHEKQAELWLGFYKKDSGIPSVTWPESVDEALCFGWIDGIRKNIDEVSYKIRFTPRRARSIWSAVNIKRAGELIEQGLMQAAGLKAFEAREEYRSGIYAYEQRSADLPAKYAKIFKQNKSAWKYFQEQPAGYRKTVNWWILSAKREETRLKRLSELISRCTNGERLQQLVALKKSK